MIYLFCSIIIGIFLFLFLLILPAIFYFVFLITKKTKFRDIATDIFYFAINKGALLIILYLSNVPFWVGTIAYFLGGFN